MCVKSQGQTHWNMKSPFSLALITPPPIWHSAVNCLQEKRVANGFSLGRKERVEQCIMLWFFGGLPEGLFFVCAWFGALIKLASLAAWGPLKTRESGHSLLWYQQACSAADREWVWLRMIGRMWPSHGSFFEKERKEYSMHMDFGFSYACLWDWFLSCLTQSNNKEAGVLWMPRTQGEKESREVCCSGTMEPAVPQIDTRGSKRLWTTGKESSKPL